MQNHAATTKKSDLGPEKDAFYDDRGASLLFRRFLALEA